ncbi:MAG: hypothetical protein R2748_26760 [Bryobacterales bacterium]
MPSPGTPWRAPTVAVELPQRSNSGRTAGSLLRRRRQCGELLVPQRSRRCDRQGSIFTTFGEDLGGTFDAGQFPLPTTLGGVQASIATADGDNFRAPLLYVSANQVNAILPSAVPAGRHQLWFVRDGQSSSGLAIKVVEASGAVSSTSQGIPVAAAGCLSPVLQKLISLRNAASLA